MQCFELFLKVRVQFGEIDLNPQTYSESVINFLIPCMMQYNQYEKAVKCLPVTASWKLLNCITSHLEFVSLLVLERPDWIRKQDLFNISTIFEDNTSLDFLYAGLELESIDDLTKHGEKDSVVGPIYRNCSLESIEKMLKNCPNSWLRDHFRSFCTSKMDSARFMQILAFFASRSLKEPNRENRIGATLRIQRFIQIFEDGKYDLFSFFSSRPFDIRLFAEGHWFSDWFIFCGF